MTLPGGVTLGSEQEPPSGLAIDPATQQLYISVQSDPGQPGNSPPTPPVTGPDEVLVGQLSADGHSISSVVTTYSISSLIGHTAQTAGSGIEASHVEDLAFDQLPTLSLTGTNTHAAEQGSAVTLLTGAPTLTDPDGGYLVSATVKITGGTFVTGDTSATDDHLAATVTGTSISQSYNAATETLTLSGYDTLAHYQTVLATVAYNATGTDPTSGGADPTRTITWQVNDGASGNPAGTTNIATTTLHIDALTLDLNGAGGGVNATLAYTENGAAAAIAPSGTLTDSAVSSLNGGSLKAVFTANGASEDQLSVITDATVTVASGVVSVSGQAVGSIDATHHGVNGDSLQINLNTANATPAAITTLLEHIGYADNSDNPSTAARTVGFTATAGDGNTETVTATVNVTAVNDAPTVSVPGAIYTSAGPLTGISFADPDGGNGIEQATFTVTSGTLTALAPSGVNENGSTTNTVTATGTIANLNIFISGGGLSFVGAGTSTLNISIDDQGNTGGSHLIGTNSIGIQTDTAPTLDLNGATSGVNATLAYTENGGAAAIAPAGTITDTDSADFNGGSLKVAFTTNGASEDQLSVVTDATVTVASGVVSVSGQAVGSIDATHHGVNGDSLQINLNTAAATPAAVTTLLQHIGYADSSDNPSTLARTVTYSVDDGDGATGTQTATVDVTAVNDPPVFSGLTGLTLTETNAGLTGSQTQTLTVTDPDSTSISMSTVAVVASGTTSGAPSDATLLSYFSNYTPASFNLSPGVSTSGAVTDEFDPGSQAFNYLRPGQSLVLTYTIRATDNDGSGTGVQTADQIVVVTINGTNDAPVFAGTGGGGLHRGPERSLCRPYDHRQRRRQRQLRQRGLHRPDHRRRCRWRQHWHRQRRAHHLHRPAGPDRHL